MEKFCVILHQVDRKIKTTPKEEAEHLSSRLTKINLVELGIEKVYLFTCKVNIFVLYVGHLIPFTGWNDELKSTIEERVNKNCNRDGKISFIDHTYKRSKDENGNSKNGEDKNGEDNNGEDKNGEKKNYKGSSRRLRSLGGGIRKIVELIKEYSKDDSQDDSQGESQGDSQEKKASLTNREIFHSLKSSVIKISNKIDNEDEKELWAQLYAVQYNKKMLRR